MQPSSSSPSSPPAGAIDRWLEIDLYWFDHHDILGSARHFWERSAPLFTGVDGWRGVILNVGWTLDYIMDWRGREEDRIFFPPMQPEPWFEVGGPLPGTTEQRLEHWKTRFARPAASLAKQYDPWTYADLRHLAGALREQALAHGLTEIRIGTLVIGYKDLYGGASAWSERHPDAFVKGFKPTHQFNAPAAPCAAFPQGIPVGTPFPVAFGRQWGCLSRALGLDAIVLRDSTFLEVSYNRAGPFGPLAPSAAQAEAWHRAACALVRETKQANPAALVIGYSNAASAVGDWRANCVDVEALAKEGFLDVWIDQTWAGAWNEVGLRYNNFWNYPAMGWTYQLGTLLVHAAMLAETQVRHYPLVETFDAWESWDVIHTAPDRLRWGIWAYSHAAVKTPHGLKLPVGTYISWANQGKRLLSAGDIAFLAREINAATADAKRVTAVAGPSLVYHRDALASLMARAAPELEIKEWIDEQAGTVMKWPVPILSITRMEWLSVVEGDAWIVQTPVSLSRHNRATLRRLIDSGQPIVLVGSAAGGIDPELAAALGLTLPAAGEASLATAADVTTSLPRWADGLEARFPLRQRITQPGARANAGVLYSIAGAPGLVVSADPRHRAAFWDPPEFSYQPGVPLRTLLGSPVPYVLMARVLTGFLADTGALHAAKIDPQQTFSIAAWQIDGRQWRLLAGNLEEGWRDDADHTRHVTLRLPADWVNAGARERRVSLPQAGCAVLDV
jgi:hypothetical protein